MIGRAGCRRLHEASLQILEHTGVRLDDPEALALVTGAGATVTHGNRAHLPAALVERALETAPREVVLFDREGEPAMVLDGRRTYFGPGSDCMHIVDHRTGLRREPRLDDVVEGVAICDALENVDFVMSLFLPGDVRREVADRHQLRVLLNGTRKPVVFVSYDISGCVDALAMAETVAGGREALSARPFLACYVNAASGLLHNRDSLQKLLLLAERNVPALYIPGGIAGLSGPATVAGSVAMINAGVLTGLVLSQLKRPGAPFVTKAWGGGGLDMRTMVYGYAEPDSRRAALRLAHYYDLPSFALAGASDAKLPDAQAAAEAALTLAVDTLAGADMIHDLGYLESGLSGSLSQLVLCDEVVGWLRHYLTKVELDADSLAVDVIDEVGPDGRFLPHAHTKRTYRQQWYPTLFDRQTHAGRQAAGAEPLGVRAAARVDGILAAHAAPSLPGDVDRRLAAIVAAAEGSLT